MVAARGLSTSPSAAPTWTPIETEMENADGTEDIVGDVVFVSSLAQGS